MPIPDSLLLEAWNQALEAEVGIAIRTNDRRYVQHQLYRLRAAGDDPRLQTLMIFMPNGDEVWICKKETKLDE